MTRAAARLACLAASVVVWACGDGTVQSEVGGAAKPAERIVTLAPHLAELVFAAGAGDRLAGVSTYSDHPPAVASLPVIGDAFALDHEALALLEPDLVLAWDSGTPGELISALQARGYRVVSLPAQSLRDVASALVRIGELAGTKDVAQARARQFETALAVETVSPPPAMPVPVFYQIDSRPLYTVGRRHFMTEMIARCGGINVFAELDRVAMQVTVEAVVTRDPALIIAARVPSGNPFDVWASRQSVTAVRSGALVALDGALIGRPGPRLAQGLRQVCRAIKGSRRRPGRVSTVPRCPSRAGR